MPDYTLINVPSFSLCRAECVKQLWAYIKKHNLQDPENKQFFFPDKTMAKVFGSDRLRAFSMSKHIGAHLS